MSVFSARKESQKILKNLRTRFDDGQRLTVAKVITENFKITSSLYLNEAKRKVYSWFFLICKRYNMDGQMFGRINDQGEYGFPNNEAEARYLGTRKYILGKGYMQSAVRVMENGMN